jgi:DNA-binding GntR family transcriptional regulator
MATAERDDEKEKVEKLFYEAIGSGDFVPGGRVSFSQRT